MPKINDLYVFVMARSADASDEAVLSELRDDALVKFVTEKPERVREFREQAQAAVNRIGRPLWIRRYQLVEQIAELHPQRRVVPRYRRAHRQ